MLRIRQGGIDAQGAQPCGEGLGSQVLLLQWANQLHRSKKGPSLRIVDLRRWPLTSLPSGGHWFSSIVIQLFDSNTKINNRRYSNIQYKFL
jgi:hypothetical protein